MEVFSRALIDEPLLAAFHLDSPGPLVRRLSENALRLRARLVALLPPRRKPVLAKNLRRIRSYPGGFVIEHLGTFPPA